MILANNTKWVCGHLLGCGKTKFEQLPRRYFHHLMSIPPIFLIWTVDHVDPHITNWVNKFAQVPREFELATYQFECDTLAYSAIRNILYWMWQSGRAIIRGFPKTSKRGTAMLKMFFFTATKLELPDFLPILILNAIHKKKIIKAFKVLKEPITSTKADFSIIF